MCCSPFAFLSPFPVTPLFPGRDLCKDSLFHNDVQKHTFGLTRSLFLAWYADPPPHWFPVFFVTFLAMTACDKEAELELMSTPNWAKAKDQRRRLAVPMDGKSWLLVAWGTSGVSFGSESASCLGPPPPISAFQQLKKNVPVGVIIEPMCWRNPFHFCRNWCFHLAPESLGKFPPKRFAGTDVHIVSLFSLCWRRFDGGDTVQ